MQKFQKTVIFALKIQYKNEIKHENLANREKGHFFTIFFHVFKLHFTKLYRIFAK